MKFYSRLHREEPLHRRAPPLLRQMGGIAGEDVGAERTSTGRAAKGCRIQRGAACHVPALCRPKEELQKTAGPKETRGIRGRTSEEQGVLHNDK